MAKSPSTSNTKGFSSKSGLLLQRNFISALDDFSKQLAEEFEKQHGIKVECGFVSRNMASFKIRFRPAVKTEMNKTGTLDVKKLLANFIKSNASRIDGFINKALRDVIGKRELTAITVKGEDVKETTTVWIGDKKLDAPSKL